MQVLTTAPARVREAFMHACMHGTALCFSSAPRRRPGRIGVLHRLQSPLAPPRTAAPRPPRPPPPSPPPLPAVSPARGSEELSTTLGAQEELSTTLGAQEELSTTLGAQEELSTTLGAQEELSTTLGAQDPR
jgi:hypothetical protein